MEDRTQSIPRPSLAALALHLAALGACASPAEAPESAGIQSMPPRSPSPLVRLIASLPGPFVHEPDSWREGLSFEIGAGEGPPNALAASLIDPSSGFLIGAGALDGCELRARSSSGGAEVLKARAVIEGRGSPYGLARLALEPSPGLGSIALRLSGAGTRGPWTLSMEPRAAGAGAFAVEGSGDEALIKIESGVYSVSLSTAQGQPARRAVCLVLPSLVTELALELKPSPPPCPTRRPSEPKAARGVAEARASPSPGPGRYRVLAAIDLPKSAKPAPPSALAAVGPYLALASKAEAGLRVLKVEAGKDCPAIIDLGRVAAPGKPARYDALAAQGDSIYASSRESRRIDRFVLEGGALAHSWTFEDKEALRGIVGICAGGDSLFAAIDDSSGDDALLELPLGAAGPRGVEPVARFGAKEPLRNPRSVAASPDGAWLALALGGSEGLALYRRSGGSWERAELYRAGAEGEGLRLRALAGINALSFSGGGSLLCAASAGGALSFFSLGPSGAALAKGIDGIGSAKATAFALEGALFAVALSEKGMASLRLISLSKAPEPGIDARLDADALGCRGPIADVAFIAGGLAACFEAEGGSARIALVGLGGTQGKAL